MTVTKYVLDPNNAQKLNIDPKRVAISGDSAGRTIFFILKDFFYN
jgi:acetyl esterase/lipase